MEQDRLVARLISRDEAAWRQFVADYGRVILAVASAFGFTGADRDDLFQNTCLTVVRSIGTLRNPAKLSSWIYNIAYRSAVDTLRRRREILLEDLPAGTLPSPALKEEPSIVEDLERAEEEAHLRGALDLLDPRCRRLLTALYLDPLRPTYAEVGRTEDIPVGSIGPLRARCLKKLRELLEGTSGRPPSASTRQEIREGESAEDAGD